MTVQKYRSVEEMDRAPILVQAGEGFERFVRHCARYRVIAPGTYPRGVFKFRTIQDAQAARDLITDENVRRISDTKRS